ncbi:MAG: threonine/serine dehydratase [Gammaproteobacteria bacterium]|nr:threonine/serine dehydratase [Gammaproteobacteria bacterium]
MQTLTLSHIDAAQARIAPHIRTTPVWHWQPAEVATWPVEGEVWIKLELWQRTGTFKARGALNTVLSLPPERLQAGLVAVSAGNHAIATAYAGRVAGAHARVVMLEHSNPARLEACRALGAQVELAEDVHQAFSRAGEIAREDGRSFVHPFEGLEIAAGTATLGREFIAQVPQLDALIVPIGGGGLCAGVATAVKLLAPHCRVIGVEPEGADTMHRSFAAGSVQSIERVTTIADSLGAPFAMPVSFALCRAHVDELVRVSDEQLRAAMRLIYRTLSLAVEPACAASTAALLGPLHGRLEGMRIGLVFCGSNIDLAGYTALLDDRIPPS